MCGQSPALRGPEQIGAYQIYLTNEKKLASSSILLAVAALRLLYQVTLHKRWTLPRGEGPPPRPPAEDHDLARRGVPPPFPAPHPSRPVPTHPLLWLAGEALPRAEASSSPDLPCGSARSATRVGCGWSRFWLASTGAQPSGTPHDHPTSTAIRAGASLVGPSQRTGVAARSRTPSRQPSDPVR